MQSQTEKTGFQKGQWYIMKEECLEDMMIYAELYLNSSELQELRYAFQVLSVGQVIDATDGDIQSIQLEKGEKTLMEIHKYRKATPIEIKKARLKKIF